MLQAFALEQDDVNLYTVTIKSPQDEQIDVLLPDPFVITVQEEPVENTPMPSPTVEPTETSQPSPTPTPATSEPTPTEDATPTMVATPTSGPTPTSLPTSPAPLPPLSEVIKEPIEPVPDSIYYRIQPKQTIYRLSRMFGTTVEAIVDANDIEDVQSVRMGTVLRIPVSPPVGKTAYFVSTKETLYSIAHAFGLTVEALADLNQIPATSYDDIEIGEWMILLPKD